MGNDRRNISGYIIPAALTAMALLSILYFSDMRYTFAGPGDSMLKLSIKHAGKRIVECDDISMIKEQGEMYRKMIKDTKSARMHLQKLGGCSRERHPVYVELHVDDEKKLGRYYKAGGWEKDGPAFIYEKFRLSPGMHRVEVKVRDSKDAGRFEYTFEEDITFEAGYLKIVDFDEIRGHLFLR